MRRSKFNSPDGIIDPRRIYVEPGEIWTPKESSNFDALYIEEQQRLDGTNAYYRTYKLYDLDQLVKSTMRKISEKLYMGMGGIIDNVDHTLVNDQRNIIAILQPYVGKLKYARNRQDIVRERLDITPHFTRQGLLDKTQIAWEAPIDLP